MWIPVSGWLGDRIGTKRTFLFALDIFVVGSALCGLAQSIGQLIFFRVLLVAASFALGGSIASLVLVKDSDAAATMSPPARVAAAH